MHISAWFLPKGGGASFWNPVASSDSGWASFYAELAQTAPAGHGDKILRELESKKERGEFEAVDKECAEYLCRADISPEARARALVCQGEARLLQGKSAEASVLFSEVLRLEPRSARALFALGAIALNENSYDEARRLFLTALEVDPLFAPAAQALTLVR